MFLGTIVSDQHRIVGIALHHFSCQLAVATKQPTRHVSRLASAIAIACCLLGDDHHDLSRIHLPPRQVVTFSEACPAFSFQASSSYNRSRLSSSPQQARARSWPTPSGAGIPSPCDFVLTIPSSAGTMATQESVTRVSSVALRILSYSFLRWVCKASTAPSYNM